MSAVITDQQILFGHCGTTNTFAGERNNVPVEIYDKVDRKAGIDIFRRPVFHAGIHSRQARAL